MNDTISRNEITDEQRAFAENALHSLPFAKLIGMRLVDLRPDEAVISIEMRNDLRQPSGVLHGGVTATLIDTAMAFAVLGYRSMRQLRRSISRCIICVRMLRVL